MTVVTHYHCHVAKRDVDPGPAFNERNAHTVEPVRMPANGRAWLSPSDPGAPTGFRLMVTASGYRAYYLIYRPRNGDKARAYRIGTAEDLSYKEAKTKAEAIRGIVADGKDPVGEEQAARERKRSSRVVTVRDVFDYFLEAHRTKLDHKTILGYEETRGVLPRSFLDEPAENVTPAMLRKLISDSTKAPVMQNRHLSRLKAAVRFARIPLPSLAVSVLRELEPVTRDRPRVFHKAGYDARTYMLAKLLAEMRRRGFGEPFSFHDLRRTCPTGLGELGCPDELNDLILGHVNDARSDAGTLR
jgi:hypothetical protein